MLVVEVVRNGKEPLADPHHPGFRELGRWMLLKQHAHCRDEQEDTKNIKDEMKALHECDPAHDHGAAHDERAHNSPDQNAVLRARRNTKMCEDDHKNKNVVHAQRVLDQVTGKKIEPVVWPFDSPDQRVKGKRDNYPEDAASRRSAHAQFTVAQAERKEIDSNSDKHADVKRDPKPDARRHRGEVFMLRGARQSQIALDAHATYTSHGTCMSHKWTLN